MVNGCYSIPVPEYIPIALMLLMNPEKKYGFGDIGIFIYMHVNDHPMVQLCVIHVKCRVYC